MPVKTDDLFIAITCSKSYMDEHMT